MCVILQNAVQGIHTNGQLHNAILENIGKCMKISFNSINTQCREYLDGVVLSHWVLAVYQDAFVFHIGGMCLLKML